MANGHGGKRAGAGRPRKSLAEKIYEGTTKKHKPTVLNFPQGEDLPLPEPPSFLGILPCPVINNGIPSMRDIFNQTTKWLERTGCVHLINPDLITKYALMTVRWLEMESIATKCLIYKDKNGDHFPNTMSDMAIKYSKAADAAWAQIWEIVQQNSETYYGDSPRHDYTSFLINNKPAR
jgi:hypothetical protein